MARKKAISSEAEAQLSGKYNVGPEGPTPRSKEATLRRRGWGTQLPTPLSVRLNVVLGYLPLDVRKPAKRTGMIVRADGPRDILSVRSDESSK
jgi:hypothetical protein